MASAPVRIRKHEAVPQTGSYEVCFSDGRPSVYFYWDNIAGRRLSPNLLTGQKRLRRLGHSQERSLPGIKMSK